MIHCRQVSAAPPLHGRKIMPRSMSKVILFTKVTIDKKIHQWPVATFSNAKDATAFVRALHAAWKSGKAEAVKELDPSVRLTEAGTLPEGAKFATATVPHAPDLPAADDVEIEDLTAST